MAADLPDVEFLDRVLAVSRKRLPDARGEPLTDQTRLLILDDIRSLVGSPLSHSWPDATLAKGIMTADMQRPDDRNILSLRKYYDRLTSGTEGWKPRLTSVDQTMHGPPLLYLAACTHDRRYRMAADEMALFLLNESRLAGGVIPYRSRPSRKICLVDTLGMICPFLAEYGMRFDNPEAVSLSVGQLEEFIAFGVETRTGLPFHGYAATDRHLPVGVIGWGRGAGWFALGLTGTLAWLDKSHPERPLLEAATQKLAATLHQCQRAGGGWGTLLGTESDYDSSATAMIAYALQQGIAQGVLDSDYRNDVDDAMASLRQHTRTTGVVDFAQGNLMSLTRHSSQFSPAPYAQGMVAAVWAEHNPTNRY